MLVLTRRLNEKVFFPRIEATVQVVSIKPAVVRLGIAAPQHVDVYREEMLSRAGANVPPLLPIEPHDNVSLEERLHTALIGLSVLRGHWKTGRLQQFEATLKQVEEEILALQAKLELRAELALV